jgi:hypothetical protein
MMLQSEARRRPQIQAWIDNLGSMTTEEIEALPTPLPWYRQAMLQMKREMVETEISDYVWARVEHGRIPDVAGMIARWTGASTFLQMNTALIEIQTGRLIFMPTSGGFWYETMFQPALPEIVYASISLIGESTKSAYIEQYKAELLAMHPIVDCIIDLTKPSSGATPARGGALAGLGVRIG